MESSDHNPASPADLTRLTSPEMRTRDARARRSIDALHEALVTLIETRSFERITIDDIVAEAGVGRSTFYRHYATKEELIDDIAKSEIDELVDLTFPLLTREDSSAACLAVVNYVNDRRRLWTALLTGGAAGVMRETFVQRSMTKGATSLAPPSLDYPIDLTAAYGVAATVEVLSWWLRQVEPVPVEKVAEYLDRFAVRPAFDPI